MARDSHDLVQAIVQAKANYERKAATRLKEVAAIFGEAEFKKQVLRDTNEAQIRQAIIDPLLEALNWNLKSSIVIEAAVTGVTQRRIDYAGIDEGIGDVVLAIEAKRPSARLPDLTAPTGHLSSRVAQALQYSKTGKAVPTNLKLAPTFITSLEQIGQYVRDLSSAQRRPVRRALLTNGGWLIVFSVPENAFISGEQVEAAGIFVFSDEQEILRRAPEVFSLLEKNRCLDIPLLGSAQELMNFVDPAEVESVLYGVSASRDSLTSLSHVHPTLTINPVLVVRARGLRWLVIGSGAVESLPQGQPDMDAHIEKCMAIVTAIHEQVNLVLGRSVPVVSIEGHYQDNEARGSLPAALRLGPEKYLFVTGNKAHFIDYNDDYKNCRFHGLNDSVPKDQLVLRPPFGPDDELRTFQYTGSPRCCASRNVRDLKSAKLVPTKPEEMAIKSDREDLAFCKILSVETHLCCRSCSYSQICAGYAFPRSPCRVD